MARLGVLLFLLAVALVLGALPPEYGGEGRVWQAWAAWLDNPQAFLSTGALGKGEVLPLAAAWVGLICFFPRRMLFNSFWFSCALPGAAQAALVFGAGMPLPFCLFIGGVQAWVQRAMLIPRLLGHEWGMAAVFGGIYFGMARAGLLNIIVAAKYPLFFHLFFLALGVIMYNALARARAWPACAGEVLACAGRLESLRKFAFSSPRLREMLDMLVPVAREYAERPKTADAPLMAHCLSRAVRKAEKALGIKGETGQAALPGSERAVLRDSERAALPGSERAVLPGSSSPDGPEKACLALSEAAYLFARKIANTYVPALDDDFQGNDLQDNDSEADGRGEKGASASEKSRQNMKSASGNADALAENSDRWGEFK